MNSTFRFSVCLSEVGAEKILYTLVWRSTIRGTLLTLSQQDESMVQTATPKRNHHSHVKQQEMVSLYYNKLLDGTLSRSIIRFNNFLFLDSHFFCFSFVRLCHYTLVVMTKGGPADSVLI